VSGVSREGSLPYQNVIEKFHFWRHSRLRKFSASGRFSGIAFWYRPVRDPARETTKPESPVAAIRAPRLQSLFTGQIRFGVLIVAPLVGYSLQKPSYRASPRVSGKIVSHPARFTDLTTFCLLS